MLGRRTSAFVALALLCSANASVANEADTRAAYQATLKCFVANGNAERERLNAGDKVRAAQYDTSGRRSYDGAFKLGQMLGLADQQVNRDLDAAQAAELPRMVKDRTYFIASVANCKALGLMD